VEEILVLCEGVPGGLDIQPLDAARDALRSSHPLAGRIGFNPVGSKTDLKPMIRAYRSARKGPLVFGIRDRDYLEWDVVKTLRSTAFDPDNTCTPWPLRVHEIESTLLDSRFVESATGIPAGQVLERLGALAERRRWLDTAKAARESLARELRSERASWEALPWPTDSTGAKRAVRKSLALVEDQCAALAARTESVVDQFALDFSSVGPLWERVDGRSLLTELSADPLFKDVAGRLDNQLRRFARAGTPPPILLDELARFLDAAAAQVV